MDFQLHGHYLRQRQREVRVEESENNPGFAPTERGPLCVGPSSRESRKHSHFRSRVLCFCCCCCCSQYDCKPHGLPWDVKLTRGRGQGRWAEQRETGRPPAPDFQGGLPPLPRSLLGAERLSWTRDPCPGRAESDAGLER